MDAVPRLNCKRKQQADDEEENQKPRLQLQTQWLDRSDPLPSPTDGAATPPYEPTHDAPPTRAKRPRIEQLPHQPAPVATEAVAGPSSTSSPTPVAPRRMSSPNAARRADELLSNLQTLHGRRWEWMTVQNGQTRLVASFRPVSQWTRASDILVSQSAPSSPVSTPRQPQSVVIPIDPCSSHIPARFPTINASTLRELEMDSIMRNPQLRHDFLFDAGLQFRASSSRRKRDQAESYWLAVDAELSSGCTCVTFDVDGRPQAVCCICNRIPAPPLEPVIACLPQRRRLTLRMPSRLRPLLQELLAVLLSIIRPPAQSSSPTSTTPPPATRAPQSPRQNEAHVRTLHEILDADLILQEVAHGAFDPAPTFVALAQILKAHCAPMRDASIDEMVAHVSGDGHTSSDAVHALRASFEILELMKLDIANHQMQTLRPHIIANAPKFELSVFRERHRASSAPFARTQAWLAGSHARLCAAAYSPPYPVRAVPFRNLACRTRVVVSALAGLVDLVFDPPAAGTAPETLYLDSARLQQLTKDAADLAALHTVLLLFRQLMHSGSAPRRETTYDEEHLARAKAEARELWPHGLGRCFVPVPGSSPARAPATPHPQGLRALVLQVAARAAEARAGRAPVPGPAAAPPTQLIALADSWADTHLKLASPLGAMLRTRLRSAVLDLLVHTVVVRGADAPGDVAPGLVENGLAPLAGEVRALVERLARLAVLHLNVYQTVYEEEVDFDLKL